MKKLFRFVLSLALVLSMCTLTSKADESKVNVQLYATVTDAGEVINKAVIDYGEGVTVSNVTTDTYKVHANASTEAIREGTDYVSYGDYDIDRTICKVETEGSKVTIYFLESEGATLAYLNSRRNVPADLTYTITQNSPITVNDNTNYVANYTCDANNYIDEETAKFTSVKVEGGLNYQFYQPATSSDRLIIWFHGGGEADHENSQNNVAQMLGNRGTVAWATDEAQSIFGNAYVMSFQCPDAWYYAQAKGYLTMAYDEIMNVVKQYGIDPDNIVCTGCSAGGYMSFRMIQAYPDLFASAIINCPALVAAADNGGATPTDEEIASLKDSRTAIWLVQSEDDTNQYTQQCSVRIFNILTEGKETKVTSVAQEIASDYTTTETTDGKYLLTIYKNNADNKMDFAEDYDQDGINTLVSYSNHWCWIYSCRNNCMNASNTHIWQWAASFLSTKTVTPTDSGTTTGGSTATTVPNTGIYSNVSLLAIAGLAALLAFKKRK